MDLICKQVDIEDFIVKEVVSVLFSLYYVGMYYG